ncbi:MAG: hypothetical protein E7666_02220 [Ruminococcaceae bacterium]|nr:hypothetical protein [Oscillospiraceae bacterium]
MEFDKTLQQMDADGITLDYGILRGSDHIVFIKSGRGGSHVGEEEKYLKMAQRIHAAFGYSVICASNPTNAATDEETDRRMIKVYADDAGFSNFSLTLIGSSNGASRILLLATVFSQTRRLLCINMPLMINYHKTAKHLALLPTVEKLFAYGTRDPSCSYLPLLEAKQDPLCRVVRVQNADHTFHGQLDELMALVDSFMHGEIL